MTRTRFTRTARTGIAALGLAGLVASTPPLFAQESGGLIALPVTQAPELAVDGPLPAARITLPSIAAAPVVTAPGSAGAAPQDAPINLFGPRFIALPDAGEPAALPAEPVVRTEIAGLWPYASGATRGSTFRFTGERDGATFTVFAPVDDMPRELVLSTISSAFVKPDASMATVSVGGTEIGSFALDAIQKASEIRFPVPAGLMTPGRNLVTVDITQAHRHFCGVDAAYDLWTDIELAGSGVAYQPEALSPGATAFLSAVATARAQDRPIKFRLAGGSDLVPLLPELVKAINGAMGGGLQFRVVTGPVGNAGAAPEILVSESPEPGAAFESGPSDQQILHVRLNRDAVPDLGELLGRPITAEPARLLPTDVPVLVTAIGLGDTAISDHLWEQHAAFRLADDWMIGTNAQADLKLDFAHASRLPKGAHLRVVVNGEVVRVLPFNEAGRDTDTLLSIRFDARRLHAGRNTIGFEISIPGAIPDEACPAEKPTLVLLGPDTTLTIPGSPRMHLPGINRAMSAMTTSSIQLFERPENAPVDDFLTLAGALPETAQREADAPATLLLLRPTDIKAELFGSFNASGKIFVDALRRTPLDLAEEQVDSFDDNRQFDVAVAEEFSLAAFAEQAFGADGVLTDLKGRVSEAVTETKAYAFPNGEADLEAWLGKRTAEAVLFQLDPERPDTVYLAVSDEADIEKVASALSATLTTGAPLDGHVAVLDRRGNWSTWTDFTRAPVLEEEITLYNWQGVAGNYASQRPLLYLAGIIAIVLLAAVLGSSYMATTRSGK